MGINPSTRQNKTDCNHLLYLIFLTFFHLNLSSRFPMYSERAPNSSGKLMKEILLTAIFSLLSLEARANFFYLEDKDSQLKIEDIRLSSQWHFVEDNTLNKGFTDSTFWVKFEVQRNVDFLEIDYPLLDQIEVFYQGIDGDQKILLGDLVAHDTRPILHHSYLIPLDLIPNQTNVIYLRVTSEGPIILPLALWTEKEFIESSSNQILAQGMYFGLMIAMILYNIF